MKKPLLIVMVGLPKSGKSTWARREGSPIVSPDAIRLAMHGQRFLKQAEPLVWGHARLMVGSLFEAGHSTVIVDACHVTKKRRNEWYDDRWNTVFQAMFTHKDVCIERAGDDKEIIPVIHRMAAQLDFSEDDQ